MAPAGETADEIKKADAAIEQWKIRRLIKNLDDARGAGTSMISLIVPPKDQIARVNKMLTEEYGTASNIKSRVNRLSVLTAITSTQQKLKNYNKTPNNGLVLYVGTVLNDEGKERKLAIDFEPFKPVNTSLYLCDNKFHTEDLHELLETDDRWGFLVMDGNGSLYGAVQGSNREILHKFSVALPKKHGRGGQSSMRFARLRLEKRANYVRKVGEICTQVFITNDKPNINGLILAGSAEFKVVLSESEWFDPRLKAIHILTVDVNYGGENGFNQAIELAGDTMANVKFIKEKRLIGQFFEEIAQDTGKYCFGITDTMRALDMGAVETLIMFEDLPVNRIEVRVPSTDVISVHLMTVAQEKVSDIYKDKETGAENEVVDKQPLTEWLVNNYMNFGAKLEFVTDKSQEGSQFLHGFGGIGGMLRYRVEFEEIFDNENNGDLSEDDFM
jgi:peptide chain release factor subunit 1